MQFIDLKAKLEKILAKPDFETKGISVDDAVERLTSIVTLLHEGYIQIIDVKYDIDIRFETKRASSRNIKREILERDVMQEDFIIDFYPGELLDSSCVVIAELAGEYTGFHPFEKSDMMQLVQGDRHSVDPLRYTKINIHFKPKTS